MVEDWKNIYGYMRLRLPLFLDNRHMKVARSALRTGRLYSFLEPQCGLWDEVNEKSQ